MLQLVSNAAVLYSMLTQHQPQHMDDINTSNPGQLRRIRKLGRQLLYNWDKRLVVEEPQFVVKEYVLVGAVAQTQHMVFNPRPVYLVAWYCVRGIDLCLSLVGFPHVVGVVLYTGAVSQHLSHLVHGWRTWVIRER